MNRDNPLIAAVAGAVVVGGYAYVKRKLDIKYNLNIEFANDVEAFDQEPVLIELCNQYLKPLKNIPGVSDRVAEFVGYVDSLLLILKTLNKGERPIHFDRKAALADAQCALGTFQQIRNLIMNAEQLAQLNTFEETIKKIILNAYNKIVDLTKNIPFPYPKRHTQKDK